MLFILYLSAANYDHSDCDCFGCAILSHGIEGRIYATDGMLSLDVLTGPFRGDRCTTLVGKPKLFFIQVRVCLTETIHLLSINNSKDIVS